MALRARSRDSPSPSEELPSPLTRGKRTATRGRGQGDSSGTEGAVSQQHPPKRLCLSSLGGPVSKVTADFIVSFLQFYFGTGSPVQKTDAIFFSKE